MSEELEALGAATTAGLAAATLERARASSHGEGAHATHEACANCGATVIGKYCAQCGQSTHIHRSLFHMVEELLHGMFHFDTKAWRTIPMLIFKPGRLTRNYIDGHRVRYVSPLALFLFMVFLSFFVASLTNDDVGQKALSPAAKQAQLNDYVTQLDEANAAVAKAGVALSEASKNGGNVDDAKETLEDAKKDASEIQKSVQDLTTELNAVKAASTKADAGKTGAVKPDVAKAEAPSGDVAKIEDGNIVAGNTVVAAIGDAKDGAQGSTQGAAVGNVNTGVPVVHSINPKIEKFASKFRNKTIDTGSPAMDLAIKHAVNNPELAIYKLKNTVYKYSFMLVPISLPFMWILFFWKRNVKMFDHAVFVLYSLCFMSVLFIVAALANIAGVKTEIAALAILIPPVHIFAQLRGAYNLGRFSALWRTCILVVVAFIVLILFALFVLLMSMH
jgi:hypothetical protein